MTYPVLSNGKTVKRMRLYIGIERIYAENSPQFEWETDKKGYTHFFIETDFYLLMVSFYSIITFPLCYISNENSFSKLIIFYMKVTHW